MEKNLVNRHRFPKIARLVMDSYQFGRISTDQRDNMYCCCWSLASCTISSDFYPFTAVCFSFVATGSNQPQIASARKPTSSQSSMSKKYMYFVRLLIRLWRRALQIGSINSYRTIIDSITRAVIYAVDSSFFPAGTNTYVRYELLRYFSYKPGWLLKK